MAEATKSETKMELRFRPSLRQTHLFCLLIGGAGLVAYFKLGAEFHGDYLLAVALMAVTGILVTAHFVRFFTLYTITDDYVQTKEGILAKDIKRAPIARVTDFNMSQSVWQSVLSLSDVGISTAGGNGYEFRFRDLTIDDTSTVIEELTKRTKVEKPPDAS